MNIFSRYDDRRICAFIFLAFKEHSVFSPVIILDSLVHIRYTKALRFISCIRPCHLFPETVQFFLCHTFSIVNDGDETGFTLRIEALPSDIPQEVVAVTPTIYNENGEYLQIKGDILTGDVITVTTKTGNKTVTLTRNGVDSNILNRLVSGSTWLTLKEGTNIFQVEAVRGVKKLRVTLMHRNSYLGV